MRILNSQSTLLPEELLKSDLIHNPEENSFFSFSKPSRAFQQENILSNSEVQELINFYFSTFKSDGWLVNDVYCMLQNPLSYPLVARILKDKLANLIGDEFSFYHDVSDDAIPVGDHFYLMSSAYTPHTDSITHIPGYVPFKDVIIPLCSDQDINLFYYICHQRYYKRATHFKYNWHTNYFSNYANIIKYQSYHGYQVTNCTEKSCDQLFFNQHMQKTGIPESVFDQLSIDHIFSWKPGSAIVHDQSVIHGPGSLAQHQCKWKLGITFHLLKKAPEFSNKKIPGYTGFSPYTCPMQESTQSALKNTKLPINLFN